MPQFAHQKVGTEALIRNKAFALFDEPGAGKSKQVIDSACQLAEQGKIDTVVVVAPASVRCVWLDAEIGEIKKHSFVTNHVYEYHQKTKLAWGDLIVKDLPEITWLVTNYEFLRSEKHLANLCGMIIGRGTLLVLDESSYVKNRTAAQTKAVKKLRQACARCVLLNGTPVTNSPLDLWSQMSILSPDILERDFKNFYHFRSEYAELRSRSFGGRSFATVVAYRRLDDLAKRVAPYVLRREKKDCLDLPEKLYTEREIALTEESWKRYKILRNEAVIALEGAPLRLEPHVGARLLRLAQLTSGLLGSTQVDTEDFEPVTMDLSDEKLTWAVRYLTEESEAKAIIVWTRWRRERERLSQALNGRIAVEQIYGGQSKSDREQAVRLFAAVPNDGRVVLIAQPHAGGHGLNLVAASEAVYLSNDFSLGIRLQSEDRCHRPGQKNKVLYVDCIAVGPKGQCTIDSHIVKMLREKKSIANMTTSEWRKALEEE